MSLFGKPLGLRGNTLTYAEYIGSHNSNRSSGPGKGDHGPIIALRLLTPESELSNELQIRGKLSGQVDEDARQQMVIITIADRLLDIQYAPPQEIANRGLIGNDGVTEFALSHRFRSTQTLLELLPSTPKYLCV
eukprot:SAG25_NODE_338_length_9538_cov_22.622630_8_plen_134_part_00